MAEQSLLFEITSPCRNICENNSQGFCKGCFRTREERQLWQYFNNSQKEAVLILCSKRRKKMVLDYIKEKRVKLKLERNELIEKYQSKLFNDE